MAKFIIQIDKNNYKSEKIVHCGQQKAFFEKSNCHNSNYKHIKNSLYSLLWLSIAYANKSNMLSLSFNLMSIPTNSSSSLWSNRFYWKVFQAII